MHQDYPWKILNDRNADNLTHKLIDIDFTNLKDRLNSKNPNEAQTACLILQSPTDLGVCRNGGRRGTKYAPMALLSCLKKMANNPVISDLFTTRISDENEEESDFEASQLKSVDRISKVLNAPLSFKQLVHIGGGHDHIFPLLVALEKHRLKNARPNNIHVINIDAHLDTRTDLQPHSGTPFRQFAQISQSDFYLTQLGIHNYSNVSSNYTKLASHAHMNIFSVEQLQTMTQNFSQKIDQHFLHQILSPINPKWKDSLIVLSLDCDGLESSYMEAVSAVNPHGLPLQFMRGLTSAYLENTCHQLPVFGIYEYNPLYENLSQKGAKAIGSLIYQFIGNQKSRN